MLKPDLIIFDMDGTLIDSESVHFKAFSIVGKEFGVPVDIELYKQFIGNPISETERILFEKCKNKDTVDTILYATRLVVKQILKDEGLSLRPGVKELLEYLKGKGYKMAVATASEKEVAINNLKLAGIYDYFSTIIGGDEVVNSKPNPDIYLKAAYIHNVSPENCIAFEDSKHGLKAAVSANMKAFLVPDMVEPTDDMISSAYKVLDVISDVIPLID